MMRSVGQWLVGAICSAYESVPSKFDPFFHKQKPPSIDRQADPDPIRANVEISVVVKLRLHSELNPIAKAAKPLALLARPLLVGNEFSVLIEKKQSILYIFLQSSKKVIIAAASLL